MTTQQYPQLTKRKCHKCGNPLLLTDVTVEKVEMQHSPVTTSTYKCSDESCREASEKEMARFIKKREEQEASRADRLKRAQEARTEKAAAK